MPRITALLTTAAIATLLSVPIGSAAESQWESVAQALGKSGTEMAGGILASRYAANIVPTGGSLWTFALLPE
jgi:hypothetical protein